jgi:hypothetical protein
MPLKQFARLFDPSWLSANPDDLISFDEVHLVGRVPIESPLSSPRCTTFSVRIMYDDRPGGSGIVFKVSPKVDSTTCYRLLSHQPVACPDEVEIIELATCGPGWDIHTQRKGTN